MASFSLDGGESRFLTLANCRLKETQLVQLSVPNDGPSYVYDAGSGAIVARGQIMKWGANVGNAGSPRYIILRRSIAGLQASVIEDDASVHRTPLHDWLEASPATASIKTRMGAAE